MDAYKFEATVQEDGIIHIPEIARFVHRPVEVFIVLKKGENQSENENKPSAAQFIQKWTGFLKGIDPDALKHEYLKDKY